MGRKGKKFIDKKKDIVHSFKVVRRSQRDPLVADETAPQGVLITNEGTEEAAVDYGVFFDDDYDYLQHLRGAKEAIDWENCDLEVYTLRKKDKKACRNDHENFGLMIPSSAFESYVEEPIGLLNKAALVSGPNPDVDPDIVAEFDRLELGGEDDKDLPDDFFAMMNSEEPIEDLDVETEEDQHLSINHWLKHEGGYDKIPLQESSIDNELGLYNEDDGFIEEITKESILDPFCENDEDDDDDEYEDIDDEEDEDVSSDFNVSDDENEPEKKSILFSKFINGGCIGTTNEYSKKELINEQYDPLGYGGNTVISDDEDEKRDVLHGLPSGRKRKSEDMTSQTSRTSHSCSHLPRNEYMSWLDERFEYVYENEYRKDQWGALDDQVIEGHIDQNSEVFQQIMETTKKQIEKLKRVDNDDTDKDRIVKWIKQGGVLGKNYEKEEYETINVPIREADSKYNCETILQYRSKFNNQPSILDPRQARTKIEINNKRGYPLLQDKSVLTKRALAKHDNNYEGAKESEFETETLKSKLSLVSYRPPNESTEDRKDRKKAVKELRRERRIERKLNREAFKEEKKQQIKNQMNNLHNKKVSLC